MEVEACIYTRLHKTLCYSQQVRRQAANHGADHNSSDVRRIAGSAGLVAAIALLILAPSVQLVLSTNLDSLRNTIAHELAAVPSTENHDPEALRFHLKCRLIEPLLWATDGITPRLVAHVTVVERCERVEESVRAVEKHQHIGPDVPYPWVVMP